MAYIEPNSDVVLLRNILVDSGYENTIYFASKSAQESYFFTNDKVLYRLTNQNYKRPSKGTLKVELPISIVEQATYMAFKNTSFENKWFYCFVDDFNYINNNTTEIVYHLDYIQTFFIGECELQQCYVLREHVIDDTVGLNRVPEPVGSGLFHYDLKWECSDMEEYSVITSATTTSTSIASDEYYKQGMFNGLEVTVDPITDATDASFIFNKLQQMLGDGAYIDPSQGTNRQQVVSLIMFPSSFTHESSSGKPLEHFYSAFPKARTNVDGYVPKNNKLLTAPFKSLLLTTGIGNGVSLDYDDFGNETDYINFKMWGVCSGSGEIICVPQHYKGVENNYDYKLIINGFPQCAYTIDAYRAWVAGGGDKYMKMGLIQGIGQGLMNGLEAGWKALSGDVAVGQMKDKANQLYQHGNTQAGLNAYQQATNQAERNRLQNMQNVAGIGSGLANAGIKYIETKYESGNMVNIPMGENSASTMVALRELNFRCYEINIVKEDAKRIDDFFSMYGYAVNEIKVPNIHQRPQWNFVKTEGCVVTGNVPNAIRTTIEQIFDSGVRFWNNGDNIGKYYLANK